MFFRLGGVALRDTLHRRLNAPHGRLVAAPHAGILHVEKHLVAVLRGKSLHDLDAATVTMHVAEAARVHQNVEAELLSGTEAAQHFVVFAAMTKAKVDNLAAETLARNLQRLPDLPLGIVAVV